MTNLLAQSERHACLHCEPPISPCIWLLHTLTLECFFVPSQVWKSVKWSPFNIYQFIYSFFKRSNIEIIRRISVFEHLVYSWWNYLDSVGRCGPYWKRSVTGDRIWGSKTKAFAHYCSWVPSCGSRCDLQFTALGLWTSVFCHAPTKKAVNYKLSETVNPQ